MNQQPKEVSPNEYLRRISEDVKSIRTMIQVTLIVGGIIAIAQVCLYVWVSL